MTEDTIDDNTIIEYANDIAKLKDILTRIINYNLDDYNMTLEDVKGECPLGLFTHGYWKVLLEAREATNK